MLLLLGQEGSQMASFSKVFANEKLKKSVQVLNESTFEALLPRMDKTTPILIEKGFTAGSRQEELLKIIKERDMVVIMKDCNAGDLLGYAAVSLSGKYVAVKNNSNGRRQQVLVMDEYKLRESSQMVERIVEPAKRQPPPEEKDEATVLADAKSDGEMISLAEFLMEVSRYKVLDETTYYWEHLTTVRFENIDDSSPTHDSAPGWLNDKLRKGSLKGFCTIDILMYATKTPRKKWIRFTLTDAVGVNAKMGSDDGWAKGFFNEFAHIFVFPGTGTNPNSSQLPVGWTRPNLEPKTPNTSTTYISATGWSFGMSGGGDPSGPNANVTASYSESNQVQTVIKDFSVRNISDSSMTGWQFYYTAVDGGKWEDHFTWNNGPKPIANLAKSTLNTNADCVYRGPPDENEKLPWNFQFKCQWAVLRGNWSKIWKYMLSYTLPNIQMTIDMGVVKNPDK